MRVQRRRPRGGALMVLSPRARPDALPWLALSVLVCSPIPVASAPVSTVPSRSSSARSSATARRSTCATRWFTTASSWRISAARAPSSWISSRRCRPVPRSSSARTVSRRRCGATPSSAACGLRCDVPARDEGPCGGHAHAGAGARDRHDRPSRTSGGRGDHGPVRRWHPSGRDPRGRRPSRGERCLEARVRHADDAVGGRRARRDRCVAPPLPRDRRAPQG
jgi:hypothetical protein